MKTRYVAGLLFRNISTGILTEVALVKKNRPEWQAGKLNAIGGHLECESEFEGQRREFEEETGVLVTNWMRFLTLSGEKFEVEFFASTEKTAPLSSLTDEQVGWFKVRDILSFKHPIIPNLQWIIPLALEFRPHVVIYEPFHNPMKGDGK